GVAIEPVRLAVVADPTHGVAHDARDVDVGLGADLPGHDHQSGRQQRLARHPTGRVLLDDGVEDGVGDLVGHLVGVTLGHGLRAERPASHVLLLPPSDRWATTASSTILATARLSMSAPS